MASETSSQKILNKKGLINEFFRINQEIRTRKNSLNQLSISDQRQFSEEKLESLNEIEQKQNIEITQLIHTRNSIKNYAELVIEDSIQSVLEAQGFVWLGKSRGLVFPPVSLRFEETPFIIVSSPIIVEPEGPFLLLPGMIFPTA